VYGVFNTASKISGSLGKGLAALSMDQQYVREREINGRKKPIYVGEGIALGIKELGTGLYNGITGIIVRLVSVFSANFYAARATEWSPSRRWCRTY
jgi:hypothetical protein